jgi:hypothetical protein
MLKYGLKKVSPKQTTTQKLLKLLDVLDATVDSVRELIDDGDDNQDDDGDDVDDARADGARVIVDVEEEEGDEEMEADVQEEKEAEEEEEIDEKEEDKKAASRFVVVKSAGSRQKNEFTPEQRMDILRFDHLGVPRSQIASMFCLVGSALNAFKANDKEIVAELDEQAFKNTLRAELAFYPPLTSIAVKQFLDGFGVAKQPPSSTKKKAPVKATASASMTAAGWTAAPKTAPSATTAEAPTLALAAATPTPASAPPHAAPEPALEPTPGPAPTPAG